MKSYVLDANVVVRFFTQDPPSLGRAARKLFEEATQGTVELRLDPAIAAEVVFVLTKVYQVERGSVAESLLDLISNPGVRVVSVGMLRDALLRFKDFSVDFADALVAAIGAAEGLPVASFDRDLDKFKDVARFEPKV